LGSAGSARIFFGYKSKRPPVSRQGLAGVLKKAYRAFFNTILDIWQLRRKHHVFEQLHSRSLKCIEYFNDLLELIDGRQLVLDGYPHPMLYVLDLGR
jgi:hypothetical protein